MRKFNDFVDWFNRWGDSDNHKEYAINNIRQPFSHGYNQAITDSMQKTTEIFDLDIEWLQNALKRKQNILKRKLNTIVEESK